eukprot:136541_1
MTSKAIRAAKVARYDVLEKCNTADSTWRKWWWRVRPLGMWSVTSYKAYEKLRYENPSFKRPVLPLNGWKQMAHLNHPYMYHHVRPAVYLAGYKEALFLLFLWHLKEKWKTRPHADEHDPIFPDADGVVMTDR